jgi:hypothetical protein
MLGMVFLIIFVWFGMAWDKFTCVCRVPFEDMQAPQALKHLSLAAGEAQFNRLVPRIAWLVVDGGPVFELCVEGGLRPGIEKSLPCRLQGACDEERLSVSLSIAIFSSQLVDKLT